MKIVSTGSTLASPEFHRKRLRARHRRLALLAFVALILLSVAIFISRQEKFLITGVEVKGMEAINAEDIRAVVEDSLTGNYFWLVPRSNDLLYPRSEIKEHLRTRFPRFNYIGASVEGLNTLLVEVVEREPFALYCPSALNPEEASACYFLDEEGFIFDNAPSFSGPVYFVYAFDKPLENPLGRSFLPPEEFKALVQFIESLSSLGIQPLSLEVRDLEFNLILPNDARILWGRESDPTLIRSNLESFLNDEAIKNQPNFLERVSELDLRTENKVFYRFDK